MAPNSIDADDLFLFLTFVSLGRKTKGKIFFQSEENGKKWASFLLFPAQKNTIVSGSF